MLSNEVDKLPKRRSERCFLPFSYSISSFSSLLHNDAIHCRHVSVTSFRFCTTRLLNRILIGRLVVMLPLFLLRVMIKVSLEKMKETPLIRNFSKHRCLAR